MMCKNLVSFRIETIRCRHGRHDPRKVLKVLFGTPWSKVYGVPAHGVPAFQSSIFLFFWTRKGLISRSPKSEIRYLLDGFSQGDHLLTQCVRDVLPFTLVNFFFFTQSQSRVPSGTPSPTTTSHQHDPRDGRGDLPLTRHTKCPVLFSSLDPKKRERYSFMHDE
jgi:hypothetical protein